MAKLDGINLVAMNSWIIENDISQNGQSSIRTNDMTTWGNAIVRKRISDKGADGITSGAGFNLVYQNEFHHNSGDGVHEQDGFGFAAIFENVLADNLDDGVHLSTNGTIVLDDNIQHNMQSGISVQGDLISNNHHYGILLTKEATGNFILRNRLKDNTPANLKNNNPNKTLLQNLRLKS